MYVPIPEPVPPPREWVNLNLLIQMINKNNNV